MYVCVYKFAHTQCSLFVCALDVFNIIHFMRFLLVAHLSLHSTLLVVVYAPAVWALECRNVGQPQHLIWVFEDGHSMELLRSCLRLLKKQASGCG